MRYFDAHCHIDLYDDPGEELAKATSADIGMLAVTNAPFVFKACRKLGASRPNVLVAVGLHPELVGRYAHQVDDLVRYLEETRFIGEVGLDYHVTDPDTHRAQREVLERIVAACDGRHDVVATVHSRGAESDVVSIIGTQFTGTTILHWYSGSLKYLDLAQQHGSFFSVNLTMLASKNGRRLISGMDPSRVLTESDGPFAMVQGRRARAGDMPLTIQRLAEFWGEESEAVRAVVMENWASAANMKSAEGSHAIEVPEAAPAVER
ncbi:MAG: TatD family hydrolase [Actinobacteria bacterium]|nr:TatD family hydrolase [Actinomycetota bacterium]